MTENTLRIDPSLVELELRAADRGEALQTLVGRLKDFGYVDGAFLEQAIQREDEYPTGLAFETIGIAIPHASPGNVNQSACAIGRCEKPVPFKNMEEPSEEIPVELICVLALKDPNDHLALMNRLMGLFGDAEQVRAIRAATTREELCRVFTDRLFAQS